MEKHRNTKQRNMTLEAVESRRDHPTADQIYADLRAKDDKISRGTVYRNLGILSEEGSIANVRISGAERYDFRLDRHYHMLCTECGKVYDAPMHYQEEYDRQVEMDTGFKINRHRIVFEGVCPKCRLKE
ncbi:MAG: Fur family transcriptional regulator [Acetatifactor sp.]